MVAFVVFVTACRYIFKFINENVQICNYVHVHTPAAMKPQTPYYFTEQQAKKKGEGEEEKEEFI